MSIDVFKCAMEIVRQEYGLKPPKTKKKERKMTGKSDLIGASALDVIKMILISNKEIKRLSFKSYLPQKHFLEENSTDRKSVGRMIKESPKGSEPTFVLKREKILSDLFRDDIENNERSIAVLSCVYCHKTRKIFHIPMLDFGCDISPENQTKIFEFLKAIGQKGYILVSDASYHFYGSTLFSEKEWVRFLGKMLLFTGYDDVRYIGHRLSAGFCALRINKKNEPNSIIPKVVSVID